jgi:leucyl aminopeptidase
VVQIAFSAKEIELKEWKGDILAVGVFEKDVSSVLFENGRLKELDGYVNGVLSEVAKEEDFSGKIGQVY